jgi:prevent-host-death family protein
LRINSKIDFKTLAMMQLRNSPGEILDRVARDGEVFVIERNGEPKACLVPIHFLLPDIAPDRIAREIERLDEKYHDKYTLTITDKHELRIGFLETAAGENIVLTVVLPHGYPQAAPRVHADPLDPETPHLWPDGSLSLFGDPSLWNGKGHDVVHVLSLARQWLRNYAVWRRTGKWPQDSDDHEAAS